MSRWDDITTYSVFPPGRVPADVKSANARLHSFFKPDVIHKVLDCFQAMRKALSDSLSSRRQMSAQKIDRLVVSEL